MPVHQTTRSIAELVGPWQDSGWQSSLVERCRLAWNKPITTLTNLEFATFLQQEIGTEYILPLARERLESGVDDESEMYDGQLAEAVAKASRLS